jgi:hypothetical protein
MVALNARFLPIQTAERPSLDFLRLTSDLLLLSLFSAVGFFCCEVH